MREVCIKCGNEENSDPGSKMTGIGDFSLCRNCARPYFEFLDQCTEYCRHFYYELEQIAREHPERLNEKGADNSVCESLNSDNK